MDNRDWYVVYDCNDGDGRNVMTVSGEFAATAEQAIEECRRSFRLDTVVILLATQDPDAVPDDLELIDLNQASEVLSSPQAISRPDRTH